MDGAKTCLYCGRVFKEQKPAVPPLAVTLKNNERVTQQAHKNLLNNVDGSLDYCLKRGIGRAIWSYRGMNFTMVGENGKGIDPGLIRAAAKR